MVIIHENFLDFGYDKILTYQLERCSFFSCPKTMIPFAIKHLADFPGFLLDLS